METKNKSIITVEVLRRNIIDKIKQDYGMSVNEFSKSSVVKDLGITPGTLRASLSNGSISYPLLHKLYRKLKLGTLKRVEKRTVEYIVEDQN